MISDERSPSGGDNTVLDRHHNNNNGENSLYYEYIPQSSEEIHSESSSRTASPPSSPLLTRSQSHQHFHHPQNNSQLVLRDHPPAVSFNPGSTVSLPRSYSTNGLADFIQHHLSSRLIPKLGSIVKRFSLNYSGEGLVTDRQRTRTVRVGIRFQVQVDSFVNRQEDRPRAILRTQSAPAVEQLDSGFSSPTEIFQNNRHLAALEYQTDKSSNSSSHSSLGVETGGIIIGGDSSSGVSSEASSPVLNRRERGNSTTLAFHNRINQALHSYRSSQSSESRSPSSTDSTLNRRSSVQVLRRGSSTPPERSDQDNHSQPSRMEDSSSYQVLRHFPGSNVNSLNELNWETAAFEKEIRDRIQWVGDKITSIRLPRVVSQMIDFGKEYARENPVTAFILLALCLTSSAPILMFLVFAVATILVTFLGFLFVEGTLLTVATVIFGGVIVLVGFVTLTAVLIGMIGYFTTNEAYLVLTGQSRIFRLLRKLPIIGRFFPEVEEQKDSASSNIVDEDEEISKILNGIMANGKIPNGYGPHHDSDEFDDLLDSEVEEELEETTAPITTGSDSDLGVDNELEDEEDFGNQEVVSSTQKSESKKDDENEKSPSLSYKSIENESPSPSSPTYANGYENGEMESDNSEI